MGNSKSAKFVAANPLAPLADPFSDLGEDANTELQKEVSDNVNKRVTKAMEELKEKHSRGTNEVDDVDRAPTGAAYKALHQHQRQQAKALALARGQAESRDRARENETIRNAKEQMRRMNFRNDDNDGCNNDGGDDGSDSSDDDDEFDHLLDADDDDALQAIRMARIAQLKQHQSQRATNLSLGHGSYRTITQDEFLPECTGSSKYVIIHFYHDDFERCKIMDFHLNIVAKEHLEAKFLRIDAGKSPFFVAKLRIQTLPALLVFDEGKEIGRLAGFDGLAKDRKKPDEWHTGRLEEWISDFGAIQYDRPTEEIEEERRRMGIVMRGAVYSDREHGGMVDEF